MFINNYHNYWISYLGKKKLRKKYIMLNILMHSMSYQPVKMYIGDEQMLKLRPQCKNISRDLNFSL